MRARTFRAQIEKRRAAVARASSSTSSSAFLKCFAVSATVCRSNQDVLARKFPVRIAAGRRVAVRLHAVVVIENLRASSPSALIDLLLRPNVERAFARAPVSPVLDQAVGIFRGIESAFRRRSCRAGRNRECRARPLRSAGSRVI